MNLSLRTRVSAAAFTLVELLTVIAIIAILMGLLFPAIGVIKEQARKVQAKTDVGNIVAAVKQYYTEYGKYPVLSAAGGAGAGDESVGDPEQGATGENNNLFNTLRAIPEGLNADHRYNPRRVVFFEGRGAADIVAPRAGFSDRSQDQAKKGVFYDPWGKPYFVVVDSDYDNIIRLDNFYSDFSTTNAPRVGVGAFAMGKDQKLGNNGDKIYKNGSNNSDDVISWQ